jgi:hypothetical protein
MGDEYRTLSASPRMEGVSQVGVRPAPKPPASHTIARASLRCPMGLKLFRSQVFRLAFLQENGARSSPRSPLTRSESLRSSRRAITRPPDCSISRTGHVAISCDRNITRRDADSRPHRFTRGLPGKASQHNKLLISQIFLARPSFTIQTAGMSAPSCRSQIRNYDSRGARPRT